MLRKFFTFCFQVQTRLLNMNVFLMKSGGMFRFAAIFGRFASLSPNRTIVQIHKPTNRCLLRSRPTSHGSMFNSIQSFCQQETETLRCHDKTEHPILPVPDFAVSKGQLSQREMFYQELKECRSPSDVLDLVDRCSVAHWSISNSLTHMWHTTKKIADEQRHWELRLMAEHPAFEKLCHSARVNAPRMHSHNLAFTLMALVKLRVSQNSYVVQTLLRVIQVVVVVVFY